MSERRAKTPEPRTVWARIASFFSAPRPEPKPWPFPEPETTHEKFFWHPEYLAGPRRMPRGTEGLDHFAGAANESRRERWAKALALLDERHQRDFRRPTTVVDPRSRAGRIFDRLNFALRPTPRSGRAA